jgi:hypothetical protein
MDAPPAEPEQPPSAAKKILALTKFHATLAATTQLLLATNQHHQQHSTLANVLAYLHLWCATLGFTWWYAVQCGSGGGPLGGWVQMTG